MDLNLVQRNTFWEKVERDCQTRTFTSSDTGDKYLKQSIGYLHRVLSGKLRETDTGWATIGPYALQIQIHNDPERVTKLLNEFFGAGHLIHMKTWNGERNIFTIDLEPTIILEDEDESVDD